MPDSGPSPSIERANPLALLRLAFAFLTRLPVGTPPERVKLDGPIDNSVRALLPATMTPVTYPAAAPMTTPAAEQRSNPAGPALTPPARSRINTPTTTALSAIKLPTERSMPRTSKPCGTPFLASAPKRCFRMAMAMGCPT